ncbi:MAG: hypothetical protein AAGK37_15800 [Pseudomonadota bacterium]
MRSVLMILSVFGVLTGCVAGVDPSLDSAAEMRAAVGRSAHIMAETHTVARHPDAVTATIAARAQQCLDAPTLTETPVGVVLVTRAGASGRVIVVDLGAGADGTELTVTRARAGTEAEAAAILAWAIGNTGPCPSDR